MEEFDWFMGVFVPFVNFAIFIGAALFFFRKPIRSMITSRRQKFESAKKSAEAALIEAKAEMRKLEDLKSGLTIEIEKMRTDAKSHAQKESDAIIASAKSLADRLTTEAELTSQNLIDSAARQLEARVLKMTRVVVTEQIKQKLDKTSQEELLSSQSAGLDSVVKGV